MNQKKLTKKELLAKLQIIPKPDYVSWEELTEVVHLAFAEKKTRGLNYLGTHQDVETTKRRVGNGICLVALIDKKVIGTVTLRISKPSNDGKKWHNENLYGYASQDAVLPAYKGLGVGKKLMEERFNICKKEKVDELLMHTSIHANDIIGMWKRQGAQKIELISSKATNYYAVRMRLPINGKKFNKFYTSYKYYLSVIRCRLIKNKFGQKRSFIIFFNYLNG